MSPVELGGLKVKGSLLEDSGVRGSLLEGSGVRGSLLEGSGVNNRESWVVHRVAEVDQSVEVVVLKRAVRSMSAMRGRRETTERERYIGGRERETLKRERNKMTVVK